MKNKGLLIIFSGPSGCGKGTLMKQLMEADPNIHLSVSATTRLPREGEVEGVHYYFLTTQEFEKLIASDGMLEHAAYCDNYYGTPKAAVEQMRDQGKDVFLEIEVQGALQVMEKCPDAVSIFVLPPDLEELKRRLIGRNTEDAETVAKRLAKAREEIEYASRYDHVVVNDDLSEAVDAVRAILAAEKSVVS